MLLHKGLIFQASAASDIIIIGLWSLKQTKAMVAWISIALLTTNCSCSMLPGCLS